MAANEWSCFSCCFVFDFSRWHKHFSPLILFVYSSFLIFSIFFIIVYKLALFFLTSQPKVTRPLAALRWGLQALPAPPFCLVSQQPPQLRREARSFPSLGGPRKTSRQTLEPVPAALTPSPEQSSPGTFPTTCGSLSTPDASGFHSKLGGGHWALPAVIDLLWNWTPPC